MLASIFTAIAVILAAPWWADDGPSYLMPQTRPPVTLRVESSSKLSAGGFDLDQAARRVVDGAAERLRSRGVPIQTGQGGGILVGAKVPVGQDVVTLGTLDAGMAPTSQGVTLSVGFGSSDTGWASGTETRFGGDGESAWRLAQLVQHHFVNGLWDVLGYDSYDRGVIEHGEGDVPRGTLVGLEAGSPWVESYPLFTTNLRELSLLEWPETQDLLASALADAVNDYLDPSLPSARRSPEFGWRSSARWQPVEPKLIYQADQGTKLALTFDGGASSAPTPAILKALREAGVHATMFMTADYVEKNPDLVVQMARDGHEFGNHSSTHPDMTKIPSSAMIAELDKLESSVVALTGKNTRPWFRPPFGAQDDRVVKTAGDLGYYTIMWTADSADWREDVSAATVESRLLRYAAPGAILIEHLGSPQTAQVLPDVLRQLKERGFSFGTLSEVLGVRYP